MPKHFAIVLFVQHPNLDPEDVSRELALRPLTSWKAGEPRETPKEPNCRASGAKAPGAMYSLSRVTIPCPKRSK